MKADKNPNPDAMNAFASGNGSYCNDPEAINYNYNFPGNPDNSVCIYPTDPFVGTYELMDTVYTADYASYYVKRDTVVINAINYTKMSMAGLCDGGQSLQMTAGRYYRGSIDTTIGIGQPLCAAKDTVNGIVSIDSLGDLSLMFTMYSDTAGVKFHIGKGTKLQ